MAVSMAGLLIAGLPTAGTGTATAQEHTVRVGVVKSVVTVANMIAIDKGYFKAVGIKSEVIDLDASTDALALLAQGQFQVIEGGIAAGLFNAVAKKFPVIIASDRVQMPNNHKLIVRTALKDQITDITALKGRTIGINAASGGLTVYELGKIMESAGLGYKDVETKVMPFPQMAIALANKAVDGAIIISPFYAQVLEKNIGFMLVDPDQVVKPGPLTSAVVIINTDWAAKNPQLVRDYFAAYLRGVRDYCQAYHGGSNRREVIELAVRTGTETRPEVLEKLAWPSRSPVGRVAPEVVLDMQDWFHKNGMIGQQHPLERLVDTSYVAYANDKLGAFELENKASPLAGCR